MLIKLYEEATNPRDLKRITECFNDGGLVIYPTDTIYALGCSIHSKSAIDKVARIKGIKAEKADFSFIFYDLSHISEYTKQFDTRTFKLLKRNLPGAFTFILPANNSIPKIFKSKKKTLGIRIPDNAICRNIVQQLGHPIISTSIHDEDEILEYSTDPELIYEKYKNKVDIVIDGGYGNNEASTIVDLSEGEIDILREGVGELQF